MLKFINYGRNESYAILFLYRVSMSKLFCSLSDGFNSTFCYTFKFLLIPFCEALLITQQTFNCSKATIEVLEKGK